MTILKQLQSYRKRANNLLADHRNAKKKVETEEAEHETVCQELEHTRKAQLIVQGIAQSIQEKAHKQISSVVTKCIHAVFEDPYDFEIKFVKRRGQTEADLTFYRNGIWIDKPIDSSSGGVISVAALALRLTCLVLSRPKQRRVILLDEPFRDISEENQPRVTALLKTLAEEMKVQFILITQIEELKVGKVVRLP